MTVESAEARPAQRRRLLAARRALPEAEHRAKSQALLARLRDGLRLEGLVGFYWPYQAEWDARPLIVPHLAAGGLAALPRVVGRDRPLQFLPWSPGAPMEAGPWGIPHPATGDPVQPDMLIIAVLGFDARGYRLGYGGGFYDRTLAAMDRRPTTIGVGFEIGRLDDVGPQPHDIPLDMIATEAGLFRSPAS